MPRVVLTDMPPRPSTTHALHLDDLFALVSGECELLREVAELGASDLVRLLASLDSATDARAMTELAHELKGVLLNLTAAPAAARALAIEHAARSGDLVAARRELVRSRHVVEEVVATLVSVATESQRAAS